MSVFAGSGPLKGDWAGVGGFRDGPGEQALFYLPTDLAIAPDGSIIVADSGNARIRRIRSDGVVETVAGTGTEGVVDGPGATARFRIPVSVDVGPDGTIYVVDSGAYNVRAIAPDGRVRTVAGIDFASCQPGLGDKDNPAPRPANCPPELEPRMRDGPADRALFNQPAGVAVGPDGALYVSDCGNHRIRRIDSKGTVSTLAGSGSPGHADGPAAKATLTCPGDLSFGPDGTLFVGQGTIIRTVSPTGIVGTLSGSFTAGFADGERPDARFAGIAGLVVTPFGVLVADQGNVRLRRVDEAGRVQTVAGTGEVGLGGGPALSSRFSLLTGVALGKNGDIYVADYNFSRIFVLSAR